MVGKVVLTCFMISMLFPQYGWSSIVKRRITGGDNHITSQEISSLCCRIGAGNCCPTQEGKAKQLAHNTENCKEDALAMNACGSFEDRKYARDVHYCGVLLSINEKVENDLKPRLNRHMDCALADLKNDPAGFDKETYTMPSRIVSNVEVWHKEFIGRHKDQNKCCSGTRVSQLKLVPVQAETSPDCKSKFFEAVDEFVAIYEYVHFIEHLGRNKDKASKKPCPRGCGTRMEVFNCGSSLLDYINVTPPSSLVPPAPPMATILPPVATVVISPTEETSASSGTESKVAYLPVSS